MKSDKIYYCKKTNIVEVKTVKIKVLFSNFWGLPFPEEIKENLSKLFPEVEFEYEILRTPNDALKAVENTKVDGLLLFVLSSIPGIVRPVLMSGLPTIVINETYGGSGEFLLEYSKALKEGMPVIAVSTRNMADEALLKKYVGYLVAIARLKESKILLITSKTTTTQATLEFPLSVDMHSTIRDIQAIFKIQVELMPINEFKEKYYETVNEAKASELAEKWVKEAPKVVEHGPTDLLTAAKLYLALKAAIESTGANAVAFNCIPLFVTGEIDAWPCVPFLKLQEEGIPGVCEGDLYSAALMLLMKHLADKPGYINDPAVDDLKQEVVYYHCYSPINMYGYNNSRKLNYAIVPSHGNTKKQSVWAEYPVGEKITVLGLSPAERIITLHVAEIVGNEYGPHVCATKVVAKVEDTRRLAENWPPRSGWHRVIFLGDLREDVVNVARLLGLKVVEPA